MFTRNYYKLLAKNMCPDVTHKYVGYTGNEYDFNTDASGLSSILRCLRDYGTNNYAYVFGINQLRTTTTQYAGVVLGDGDTPATIDDIKMSGNIISGYTYNYAVNCTVDDTGFDCECLYTITNTSGSEFTVKEIGMIANCCNSANQTEPYKALLERTVLTNPITIPAGSIGQVSYKIRMNYPTA